MTEAAVNSIFPRTTQGNKHQVTTPEWSKSKGLIFLEYVLLALCLCVIALRTTFTEGLNAQSANQPINFSDSVYSLLISAVLIFSLLSWFVWSFCSKRFLYRFTAIEIGIFLFCVAAIVAGLAAANKRAAITDAACFIAPLFMAILLVQILDSQSKIKLLLVCIAALGVVSAYQCAEQLFYWNEQDIKFYEQNPDAALAQQNITPGSLQHWQFEHRLYSKDVKGFFTTGNSAGSFALLASFAALALFSEKLKTPLTTVKNRKLCASGHRWLVTCGIAVAAVFFGLVITRSKGAIIASLIAATMFIAYLLFGNWLKAHKKAILITSLLLGLAGACAVVLYGLAHDRLPGGNSMLVRWQYWRSTAKMYADHPFTGIGPGNFTHFYPHYKPASALESVADPHNFLLSVLTGYGPLGLIGFLAMIFIPLWRVTFTNPAKPLPKANKPEPAFRMLAITFLIIVSAALLVIRPIIMPVTAGDTLEVMIYVIFILYVAPVVAFVVGFLLLATNGKTTKTAGTNIAAAIVFCAVLGALFHNLIDFAIFEPGVFTTFWAIIACLIAADSYQKSRTQLVLKPRPFVKAIAVVSALVIIWAYFNYALIPVARSTAKIQQAQQAASNGKFEQAHNLLAAAAKDDGLSPTALSLNGRLYLQRSYTSVLKQADLLLQSKKCLLAAIERNRADFKDFERLAEVYTLLADNSTGQAKTDWLNKAFGTGLLAVERYPGCGRLRVELARIAEQLGKVDIAIEQYRKAIDIEDSFRHQFRLMYPGRQIFSRLGEEKYQFAIERLKKLSNSDLSF